MGIELYASPLPLMLLEFLEMALSAVMDTLLLPYTVFHGWKYESDHPPFGLEELFSCGKNTKHLSSGMDRLVNKHGWLPHEPGLPGEELFLRLDISIDGQNCHVGAPNQRTGGWQMINASPETWGKIIKAMEGDKIPILWCGRPHASDLPGETGRWVLWIDDPSKGLEGIRWVTQPNRLDSDELRKSGITFRVGYVHDDDFERPLRLVNAVLEKIGEPEVLMNVEGREDYWSLAEPYQAEWLKRNNTPPEPAKKP